jgi:hypothetical protein
MYRVIRRDFIELTGTCKKELKENIAKGILGVPQEELP